MTEISDAVVSIVFLSGCRICDRLLTSATRVPPCEECIASFESVPNTIGEVCRLTLLKFEQIEPLGARFAERLADLVKPQGERLAAEVGVPVPLHGERERERGFDQATLLSQPLAKRLRLPHKVMPLMRTRARPDNQVLSLEERWESVCGAFATRPGTQVDNLRVLLVDNVMTTGTILDPCARVLREGGAKSVIRVTVGRAVRNAHSGRKEW